MALLLLEHGADAKARDSDGSTPLHVAADNGCEEVARLLLEHGVDRFMKNNDGETARDVAKREDKMDVVSLLDTYFPVPRQMVQVLLGLRDTTPSPLTRFASHCTFEPNVLSLIKCLLTGAPSSAFEKLQHEARAFA